MAVVTRVKLAKVQWTAEILKESKQKHEVGSGLGVQEPLQDFAKGHRKPESVAGGMQRDTFGGPLGGKGAL